MCFSVVNTRFRSGYFIVPELLASQNEISSIHYWWLKLDKLSKPMPRHHLLGGPQCTSRNWQASELDLKSTTVDQIGCCDPNKDVVRICFFDVIQYSGTTPGNLRKDRYSGWNGGAEKGYIPHTLSVPPLTYCRRLFVCPKSLSLHNHNAQSVHLHARAFHYTDSRGTMLDYMGERGM